jgi:Flp pilus assembly protein TadD
LFNAGLTTQTEHNYAQAVSDFTASLVLDPTNVYAEYDLGIAQTSLGNTAAAAAGYRKAIALQPTFKAALFNLADLLTPTEPATAINLFKRLEKIDPKDANVEFNLGLLLESQGQVAVGEAQLKAALIANPALKSRVPKGTQLSPGTP